MKIKAELQTRLSEKTYTGSHKTIHYRMESRIPPLTIPYKENLQFNCTVWLKTTNSVSSAYQNFRLNRTEIKLRLPYQLGDLEPCLLMHSSEF